MNTVLERCADVTPLLDEARRGELAPELQRGVEAHLESCPNCRADLAALARVADACASLPRAAAPATLLPDVRARARDAAELTVCAVPGPLGPLVVACSARGIAALELDDDPEAFARRLAERTGRPVRVVAEAPRAVRRAVAAATRGARADVTFDLSGLGAFERAVLEKTREIPPGEVRSYAWIAREIGRPGAVRAVGQALHRNPVPLLIPCHRVVRSDGTLGGYALGLEVKRRLLRLEGLEPDELERAARAGARLIGSRTTRVFCLPTCRHARRIGPQQRVAFPDAAAAARAGFRPCRSCRPVAVLPAERADRPGHKPHPLATAEPAGSARSASAAP